MFTWGIISGAQAFVVGETSFNIVRLLLGVAEARLFPGIIFFLTLWIPVGLSGADRRYVYVCDSDLDRHRLADLGAHSQLGRYWRVAWLAVDISDRGWAPARC